MGRVLVIGGEYEGLMDTIEETARAIAREMREATVFVSREGVHDDLILAFEAGEEKITGWSCRGR